MPDNTNIEQNAFQFHKGTIRTYLLRLGVRIVELDFNSIKVRLELAVGNQHLKSHLISIP